MSADWKVLERFSKRKQIFLKTGRIQKDFVKGRNMSDI